MTEKEKKTTGITETANNISPLNYYYTLYPLALFDMRILYLSEPENVQVLCTSMLMYV